MKRVLLSIAIWVVSSCGGDGGDPPSVDSGEPGADAAGADAATGADTWTSYADGWFQTYCNSCHQPGGAGYRDGALDFRMYDLVVANAAEIRCGVSPVLESGCMGFPPPAQFPIGSGPFPTDEERNRLVDWIESGTPQ